MIKRRLHFGEHEECYPPRDRSICTLPFTLVVFDSPFSCKMHEPLNGLLCRISGQAAHNFCETKMCASGRSPSRKEGRMLQARHGLRCAWVLCLISAAWSTGVHCSWHAQCWWASRRNQNTYFPAFLLRPPFLITSPRWDLRFRARRHCLFVFFGRGPFLLLFAPAVGGYIALWARDLQTTKSSLQQSNQEEYGSDGRGQLGGFPQR